MRFPIAALMLLTSLAGAEKRPASPPGIKPIGPYSPGILTQDFLYVSGQGAKRYSIGHHLLGYRTCDWA